MTARKFARRSGVTITLVLAACSGGGGESTDDGTADSETNEHGGEVLVASDPAPGGDLVIGILAPVESLDPGIAVGASMQGPIRAIYDSLMSFDGSGAPVPNIAESMESDDSLTTWTMTLPEGIVFHDGTPFDAEAVIANTERVAAEGSTSLQVSYARAIESMEAPDDTTVVFTLAEPWGGFPGAFADGSLAFVTSPTAVAEAGDAYGLNPVGAGPYTLESFSPGADIVLVRNDDYHGDAPFVDKITYKVTPEDQSRLAAVQTGDLDIAALTAPADIAAAEAAGLTVLEQPSYTNYSLVLNLTDEALGDVRIRQALNMAVDKDAINQVLFDGANTVMRGMLNETNPFFTDADWPTYDPDEAARLVDEYVSETGNDVEFELLHTGTPATERITGLLQQMYADAGITVNVQASTPAAMITAVSTDAHEIHLRLSGVVPETLLRLEGYFVGMSPLNAARVTNDVLAGLVAEGRAATTQEERTRVVDDMQTELAQWLPQVPLVAESAAFVLGPDVTAFPGLIPSSSPETFDTRLVAVIP